MKTSLIKAAPAMGLLKIIAAVALAALLLVIGYAAPTASAQTTCPEGQGGITFDGKPLCGPPDVINAYVMNELRPAVAAQESDGTNMSLWTPTTCFGKTERVSGDWRKLTETKLMTVREDGMYLAVAPTGSQHGDWPTHHVLFKISASRPLACDEMVSEISYRMLLAPKSPITVTYSYMLDSLVDYPDLFSGGGGGLFVTSPTSTPLTVNRETFLAEGCHNCPSFTRETSPAAGSSVYSSDEVEWFGQVAEGDVIGLGNMHVTKVPRIINKQQSVTVRIGPEAFANGQKPKVYMFFGRFDPPLNSYAAN